MGRRPNNSAPSFHFWKQVAPGLWRCVVCAGWIASQIKPSNEAVAKEEVEARADAKCGDGTEPKLICPECGTDRCVVVAEQSFMVNTWEHYCHSVKLQDDDAKAKCLDCEWAGRRDQLKEVQG